MNVWLVGTVYFEHDYQDNVEYVCLSEESAKNRWKEIQQRRMNECLDRINEGKKDTFGYELATRNLRDLNALDPEKLFSRPNTTEIRYCGMFIRKMVAS